MHIPWIQQRLKRTDQFTFALYAALVSFGTYSCMYAFRKPFAVALFEGVSFLGIDYKIWLVIAQTMGYAASKFYGIRFIAEMQGAKRARSIVLLIIFSWLALLLFAVVPAPYNVAFLSLNGFPLGMIWGLVFSYLEGRQSTEFMGAVLSISFIFSSGFVKSAGMMVMVDWGIAERWMPFVTGLIFLVPMLIFVALLEQIPPPSAADEALRTRREPMDKQQRRQFLQQFLPGLSLCILSYVMLTMLRDMRDNFAANIWQELGMGEQAAIFTQTEVPVSLVILGVMGLLVFIKDNYQAFMLNFLIVITGFVLAGLSSLLFMQHHIGPVTWMTMAGLGLYLGYIPFNCIFFERLIATFKYVSNVGFIIYVADSFGYLGSVSMLLVKNFSKLQLSWSRFFMDTVLGMSVLGILLMLGAYRYFRKKYRSLANPASLVHS
jgi:MFS family permease